jgi:hypothetical protein
MLLIRKKHESLLIRIPASEESGQLDLFLAKAHKVQRRFGYATFPKAVLKK